MKPVTQNSVADAEARVVRRKAQLADQAALVGALGRRAVTGPAALGVLAIAGLFLGRLGLFGKAERMVESMRPRKKRGLVAAALGLLGPRVLSACYGVARRVMMASPPDVRQDLRRER